jgi:hypothetical protein
LICCAIPRHFDGNIEELAKTGYSAHGSVIFQPFYQYNSDDGEEAI